MVYDMTYTVLLYVAVEAGSKMQKWFLQNSIAMCSNMSESKIEVPRDVRNSKGP